MPKPLKDVLILKRCESGHFLGAKFVKIDPSPFYQFLSLNNIKAISSAHSCQVTCLVQNSAF